MGFPEDRILLGGDHADISNGTASPNSGPSSVSRMIATLSNQDPIKDLQSAALMGLKLGVAVLLQVLNARDFLADRVIPVQPC